MTFMQYTSDIYLKNFFLKLCVLLVTITVSCSSDPITVGSSGSNNGSGNSSDGSGTTTSDLNINNNLKKYQSIIPCGISDKGVTNLKSINNQNYNNLNDVIVKNFTKNLEI